MTASLRQRFSRHIRSTAGSIHDLTFGGIARLAVRKTMALTYELFVTVEGKLSLSGGFYPALSRGKSARIQSVLEMIPDNTELRIMRLICISDKAHCRRKIADAIKAGDVAAVPFLEDIAKLYAIEKEANTKALTDVQRGCLRHAKARPILKNLQRMFRAAQRTALPKSALGEAARYAVNQWPELARYAKAAHGRIRIDNNPVERGIRPTKLGMRNWLFIGHPDAGWRSAVIYSIVGTCKLLGVNPEGYLNWVLPKLAVATTQNSAGLLPHDYTVLNAH